MHPTIFRIGGDFRFKNEKKNSTSFFKSEISTSFRIFKVSNETLP